MTYDDYKAEQIMQEYRSSTDEEKLIILQDTYKSVETDAQREVLVIEAQLVQNRLKQRMLLKFQRERVEK